MRDRTTMSEATRLITAEELEKFPDDDHRYELVAGRVVRMTPVGFPHSQIAAQVAFLLIRHIQGKDIGAVVTELGCKLASNPDTVRAPDVAFIRRERIPSVRPKGFWTGGPDLAIEVMSPDDTTGGIRAKAAEYLTHGVSVVVVLDPEDQTAVVYRSRGRIQTLKDRDSLDLDDVVSGFRCEVREIFE